MPDDRIIVSRHDEETRIAVLERGQVCELLVEREGRRGVLGNVYKGRVTRVLPGMQSAFVDIGLQRTAFLYVADVARPKTAGVPDVDPDEDDPAPGMGEWGTHDEVTVAPAPQPVPIEELLREGQEIVCQVTKEPIGTKGARLTTQISLPGRHLVLLPGTDHVGVSRRITDEGERERLKALAATLKPDESGLIVRTASEGQTEQDFAEDARYLHELWQHIQEKAGTRRAPALLYEELDVVVKVVRDTLTEQFEAVVVDHPDDFARVVEFVDRFMPQFRSRVLLHQGPLPVFEKYKVELELNRALDRKVWLKSGGTIVIDETEALTAIDVNTGRYVGKTNAEETILKINLEAVKEIAYQLRLRNIGGIIVIDFIDLKLPESREAVQKALTEELARDRARTHVLPMSELGLVEMTRKRTKKSVRHVLTAPCFYCSGKGYLKSHDVIASEILNRVVKEAIQAAPGKRQVLVYTHPAVMEYLFDVRSERLQRIEEEFGRSVVVRPRAEFHLEQFEVYAD